MRIKHYIVTYNNNEVLNNCLESLWDIFENYTKDEYQVYIINNHSNFSINRKFERYVEVIHNDLRPDFSTGHLSRNWNQAILHGFKDLNNPDCDILVTNQNDCEFDGDFVPNLIEWHKKYSFMQFGAGDNYMSYTVDSIKRVGLWDERFCNIGYQEADYFLRQMLYNTDGCTINDYRHLRVHNGEINNIIKHTVSGFERGDNAHHLSQQYHSVSEDVYTNKWGDTPYNHAVNGWNYDGLKSLEPKIPSFMYYPYFEKNVNSLHIQKYIGFSSPKSTKFNCYCNYCKMNTFLWETDPNNVWVEILKMVVII